VFLWFLWAMHFLLWNFLLLFKVERIGTCHVDKNFKRPEFDENFSKP
jgi:hypothetical protein